MNKKRTPPTKVGEIKNRVVQLLNLPIKPGTPIYIGQTNIEHIKREHPDAFEKYFDKLPEIIESPDYVAKHPNKDSIEFIKIYEDHVLVAVRVSQHGVLYARTLFIMSKAKVQKYARHMKKY